MKNWLVRARIARWWHCLWNWWNGCCGVTLWTNGRTKLYCTCGRFFGSS